MSDFYPRYPEPDEHPKSEPIYFTIALLSLLTVAVMAYLLHTEQERTRKAEKQVDYLLDQIANKTIEDVIKEAKQRERLLAEAKAKTAHQTRASFHHRVEG